MLVSILFFISIIAIHEAWRFSKLPTDHPRRHTHLGALFALCLIGMFIGYAIFMRMKHEEKLTLLVPHYPKSEISDLETPFLTGEDYWVYKSEDSVQAVITWYANEAKKADLRIVAEATGTPAVLVIDQDRRNLFITVVSDGNKTVIRYSREGNISER